jgi:opacity protein-like surface antigen
MKYLNFISIAFTAMLLLIAISAFSQSRTQTESKSFLRDGKTYVQLNGSILFDSKLTEIVGGNSSTSGTTEGDIPKDFGFSAAIGRTFPISDKFGNLSVEGEFISHPAKEIQEFGGFEFENEFNTQAYMGNLSWIIPIQFLEVSLGGGVGSTKLTLKTTSIDNPSFSPFEQSSSGLALQFQAGIGIPIGDLITVGVGYRLFNANDVNSNVVDPTSGEMINVSWDLTTHRGEIGVGVRF